VRTRPYERVPHDVTTALVRRELTALEHNLLCFLIGSADYRKDPPEYNSALAGLMEAVWWEQTEKSLQRAIRKLKRQGWIDYRARTGPGNIYVIRLLSRASLREELTNPCPNSVPIAEAPFQFDDTPNPHGNSDSATAESEVGSNRLSPPTTATTPTPTPTPRQNNNSGAPPKTDGLDDDPKRPDYLAALEKAHATAERKTQ
jgi:hypothetical protein